MIFSALNPYILYVKIALAAALLAGAGYTGWKVRDWQCDAARTDAFTEQIERLNKDIVDYKAELDEQEKFKDAQRDEYHQKKARYERRLAQLEEDLKNARLTPQPTPTQPLDPDRPFSREFVRLWNDAIRAANGDPTSGEAGGSDVSRADTSTAGVTREDVIAELRKITRIYAGCKLKHDKIIEFERTQQ